MASAVFTMLRRLRRNPLAFALYLNAALLACILVALLARDSSPTIVAPAMGQEHQPVIAGGAGVFVVAAQFSTSTWGCYLLGEGRLREFRDGPRLMFKADQVEQLKAELGGGTLDQVDLGPSDSGAPIGLVDSRSPTGSASGIALSDMDASGVSGSGMQMQMKDDTALAGGLGVSGSVGGVAAPGAAGGALSGGGV